MSLHFLQRLEHAALPLRATDPDALRCIEELLTAQLIEGGLGTSMADQRGFAIVRRITPLGRAHLALARNSHGAALMASDGSGGAL